ncbi:KUP/HAK/KT family potassium transporter [Ferruginibacter albus]|uniref:KUP/HAK/KT family potassium transporter n=1 Tax=Ferruginibacter albus TaxID=2875540 RepID=UPI001CC4633B|nr:KUP/HAK/KT family potassium transporter [Ferruginibacter albus]UAY52333.1 KUP/HAK/KT family potassium transporter [Ferruginibacter albus]
MQTNQLKKVTAAGLLVTLGIIFGDIGTSPLYVFSSIIGNRPITKELVYGGISCVFWTLTLQTTFKYILLTLQADNRGEGGIFSLYALVWRYRHWLYFPAILGAATLLADGIITPPISVASAIEGLNGVHGLENIIVPGNALTIGIVIGIITLLFFFQQFGTKVVGSAFGPIMFLWFSMIMFWGIIQIFHFPNILAAFNPYYAIELLVKYPNGFWLLGAVFLCTTGAEALYSDLGHCGKKNIQVSWIFVKVALVANYFGQAAWLLHSGKTTLGGLNPFYEIMPHWFLIPAIVIATLATIIASQALISGSFTLISEAVSMNFWPRITIKYPTDVRGQIYIPSINWILYAGCVGMMLYFKDSNSMVVAYGFSITVAMIMTTTLMFYYMKFVKKWSPLIIALILVIFISVESSFFVANVVKLAKRWQFLIFEISLVFTMYVWFKARKISNRFLHFENFMQHFDTLKKLSFDTSIPKYATHLVYLTKANNKKNIESRIIDSILKKRPKRADVYWFVHINRTDEPYTMEYTVDEMVPDKIIRVDFNLGFRVQPRVHLFFRKVLEETMDYYDVKGGARYGCSNTKEISTDIRYVIIEKFLSVENEFSSREGFILRSYFAIKELAQSDKKAFGLDMSDTEIENIPMVIAPATSVKLQRTELSQVPMHY